VLRAQAQPAIFLLCESCHWCATFLDKAKVKERCVTCSGTLLSSFPIMPDESFTLGFDTKRGLEMDFGRRRK
jgi:hypothetical protein